MLRPFCCSVDADSRAPVKSAGCCLSAAYILHVDLARNGDQAVSHASTHTCRDDGQAASRRRECKLRTTPLHLCAYDGGCLDHLLNATQICVVPAHAASVAWSLCLAEVASKATSRRPSFLLSTRLSEPFCLSIMRLVEVVSSCALVGLVAVSPRTPSSGSGSDHLPGRAGLSRASKPCRTFSRLHSAGTSLLSHGRGAR